MTKHSLSSFSAVAVLAAVVFLVAFALLMFVGDYRFMASAFMAMVIAILTGIVLYLGFGEPEHGSISSNTRTTAPGATTGKSAAAATAAGSAALGKGASGGTATAADAEAAGKAADDDAAQKAAADAEAARKAAEDEAAQKAAADAEAARKAAEDEAARKAAADAEAARKAAEDEAAQKAAADAAGSSTSSSFANTYDSESASTESDNSASAPSGFAAAGGSGATASGSDSNLGPDYDGDGVHEGTEEGTRPAGLDGPRGGTADDLKQIKGVGPKLEKLINSMGFWHFDQVAAWTSDEVAWVDANLMGFKGRVSRDEWVEQARILASGGTTEFASRVEDGDVY